MFWPKCPQKKNMMSFNIHTHAPFSPLFYGFYHPASWGLWKNCFYEFLNIDQRPFLSLTSFFSTPSIPDCFYESLFACLSFSLSVCVLQTVEGWVDSYVIDQSMMNCGPCVYFAGNPVGDHLKVKPHLIVCPPSPRTAAGGRQRTAMTDVSEVSVR